jgi:hypothetical protein
MEGQYATCPPRPRLQREVDDPAKVDDGAERWPLRTGQPSVDATVYGILEGELSRERQPRPPRRAAALTA